MPSYAELVFHMFKMSSAIDCRGGKLITRLLLALGFLYGLSLPTAPDIGGPTYILLLQYFVYSKYS